MYCKRCGKELTEDVIFCPYCGTKIVNDNLSSDNFTNSINQTISHEIKDPNSSLITVAEILMILTASFIGIFGFIMFISSFMDPIMFIPLTIFLVPLAWTIPMIVHLFKCSKKMQETGIGFKICTLIFVNIVAGILLLCHKDPKELN